MASKLLPIMDVIGNRAAAGLPPLDRLNRRRPADQDRDGRAPEASTAPAARAPAGASTVPPWPDAGTPTARPAAGGGGSPGGDRPPPPPVVSGRHTFQRQFSSSGGTKQGAETRVGPKRPLEARQRATRLAGLRARSAPGSRPPASPFPPPSAPPPVGQLPTVRNPTERSPDSIACLCPPAFRPLVPRASPAYPPASDAPRGPESPESRPEEPKSGGEGGSAHATAQSSRPRPRAIPAYSPARRPQCVSGQQLGAPHGRKPILSRPLHTESPPGMLWPAGEAAGRGFPDELVNA